MTNKEKYNLFCEQKNVYIPIFSKAWWLDAVCGNENWDVWLYESGDSILAAMPYYIEYRNGYKYITKATLTQNNGIIFCYPPDAKPISIQAFEEKIIDAACQFITNIAVDVYEQQYHYSFRNWLPFFWNQYTAIVRYTYVLENMKSIDEVWQRISSKYRSKIKKGNRNSLIDREEVEGMIFYYEHEKIFLRQNLKCPFSYEQWQRLYDACKEQDAGKIFCARTADGRIASLLFLIWDEKSVYQLLGGSMPEFQNLDTYDALIWEGIKFAFEKGLDYDFEGSVIKRISKSFREFGGDPKPYYRIRKVFNPEIMRQETEEAIRRMNS